MNKYINCKGDSGLPEERRWCYSSCGKIEVGKEVEKLENGKVVGYEHYNRDGVKVDASEYESVECPDFNNIQTVFDASPDTPIATATCLISKDDGSISKGFYSAIQCGDGLDIKVYDASGNKVDPAEFDIINCHEISNITPVNIGTKCVSIDNGDPEIASVLVWHDGIGVEIKKTYVGSNLNEVAESQVTLLDDQDCNCN